ncbi:MAG: sigma-70 family RNA polymerase sigma factor [Acidobacteria bacterium]|nr:sigma-70 family RNA polymerase sigma factor [Acidobacteriota bacterium]
MKESANRGESDHDLVKRVLRGDKEAFGGIMQRYQRPIVNYCYRMVRNYEVSTDLAQEVFIKAYNSLRSYDPRYKLSTWLYKIASNHLIDHLRKKEPRWVSIEQSLEEGNRPIEIRDPSAMGERDAVFADKQERIEEAIMRLPPTYRRLIVLRHVNDCSYEEMARICSIPLGTVKNRLFRAREMLRASLEGIL